ncbi:MAG: preprotein translocase subunit SecG [Mangrovibacterium sp.]
MYTLITVLLIIASIFMVLIVLVQNSKGGGLASNFQSNNQVMGVRKTNDFLDKATWWLAGALLILSLAGSAFIPKENKAAVGTEMSKQIENAVDPSAVPSFPSTPAAKSTSTPEEQAPAEQK